MKPKYYTYMKCCWEELEALNTLPPITNVSAEITKFMEVLTQQQEEHKLFQFLNGLDESYGTQRSNLLMMGTLPNVETACSYQEQEEAQREVLWQVKEENDIVAMFSKGSGGGNNNTQVLNQCTVCGKTGHTKDGVWFVIDFPAKPNKTKYQGAGKGKFKTTGQRKWNKEGKQSGVKVDATAQQDAVSTASSSTTITAQQLEQLLRLLPPPSKGGDTDEVEMDYNFSSMVSCCFANSGKK